MTTTFALLAFSFLLSSLLTALIRNYATKQGLIDTPDERTSHETPTPRGGGMSVVILWIVILIFGFLNNQLSPDFFSLFFPASLLVSVIGFVDDHKSLSAIIRITGHFIASALFLSFVGGFEAITIGETTVTLGVAGSAIALVVIVWSINLFNFMDGLDTFASIEAIMVFLFGGTIFFLHGAVTEATILFVLTASVAGFLVWNLPPAKIFMGDGCSSFLGFIIAGFAIYGENKMGISIFYWIIPYSYFWFDATVTLIRRMLHGEKWYYPHKSHAYQRLHQSGFSPFLVSSMLIAVNAVLLFFSALLYFYNGTELYLFLIAVLVLAVLYTSIELINPMKKLK